MHYNLDRSYSLRKILVMTALSAMIFSPAFAKGGAVNGTCGSANGSVTNVEPTTSLCSAGTASSITGTGPWDWSCVGAKGGTTASCSASPPVSNSGFNALNPAASNYTLTFSDNFQTLNTNVWETDWWYDNPDACVAAFLPSTVSVTSGGLDLHIKSLENVSACSDPAGGQYSYAHLDSFGVFAQQYGYYEASIKSSAVGGTLTAFWLLPSSGAWPPEVDITEIRGDYPNLDYMTNHYNKNNASQQIVFTNPASLGLAYHTYGVLITSSYVTWYLDGVQQGQVPRRSDEATPMFPIFSLYTGACGDGWAGCPTQKTGWSADAYVQWIKVWQAP